MVKEKKYWVAATSILYITSEDGSFPFRYKWVTKCNTSSEAKVAKRFFKYGCSNFENVRVYGQKPKTKDGDYNTEYNRLVCSLKTYKEKG